MVSVVVKIVLFWDDQLQEGGEFNLFFNLLFDLCFLLLLFKSYGENSFVTGLTRVSLWLDPCIYIC